MSCSLAFWTSNIILYFYMITDYVFGNHKFGGNAQSITKGRWIHHTSFLWDYEMMNMAYLKLPKRAPDYRQVCKIFKFFVLLGK